jgi:hypothetical protein
VGRILNEVAQGDREEEGREQEKDGIKDPYRAYWCLLLFNCSFFKITPLNILKDYAFIFT